MTVAQHIHCPSCGQVFHLKFQVDDPIKWSKWPIVVECPECGDNMELSFSTKGLQPKQKEADFADPGILIAYCGGLPTPSSLYYQEVPSSMGYHSVFLNICGIYGDKTVLTYNYYLKRLQEGVVQWCRVLEEAYRMISTEKIKPIAYYKKLKSIFHDSVPKEAFQTPEDCVRHYEEMLKATFRALNFGKFTESPLKNLFDTLKEGFIKDGKPEKILEVGIKTRYSASLLKDVRRRININIKNLAKILPACFLDFIGGDGTDLFLLTGSIEDLNEMYADNFEVISKCLPLLIGLYNLSQNGDVDCFKLADGTKVEGDMNKYMSFDNGAKIKMMMALPIFKAAFSDILDTHIRNGINHENTEFDVETQICKYTYDSTRPDKYQECRLIDLGYRILYQLRCLLLLHRYLLLTDKGMRKDH